MPRCRWPALAAAWLLLVDAEVDRAAGKRTRMVAVGFYVMNIGGDDSYAGKSRLDFLLYFKALPISDTSWSDPDPNVEWKCNSSAWKAPSNPQAAVKEHMWFPNAASTPSATACPAGASPPWHLGCQLYAGDFTYNQNLKQFPFEEQRFSVVIEDNSPAAIADKFETKFCVIWPLTGIASRYAAVTWSKAETPPPELYQKCYPPRCDNVTIGCDDVEENEVDECENSLLHRTRFRLKLYVAMNRPKRKAFLRYFMVPSVILMLQFGVYMQDPIEDIQTRRTTTAGLFWTTTGFHFTAIVLSPVALRSREFSYVDTILSYSYETTICTMLFNGFLLLRRRRPDALGADEKPHKNFRKYTRRLNWGMWLWLAVWVSIGVVVMKISGEGGGNGFITICLIMPLCAPLWLLFVHKEFNYLLQETADPCPANRRTMRFLEKWRKRSDDEDDDKEELWQVQQRTNQATNSLEAGLSMVDLNGMDGGAGVSMQLPSS